MPDDTKSTPDWEAIRTKYIAGGVTLKQLAEEFQVPLRTIEYRSAKERWRFTPEDAGNIIAVAAREVAIANGKTLGLNAVDLIDRTIQVYKRLIERVEGYLDAGELSVSEFRQLVAGWKDLTAVGREAFGLDREASLVNAMLPQGRVIEMKSAVPEIPASPIPSDPAPIPDQVPPPGGASE